MLIALDSNGNLIAWNICSEEDAETFRDLGFIVEEVERMEGK